MTRCWTKTSGFSLIEMTLVLVIVGLLLGGTLAALGAQRESQKVRETETQLASVQEALQGFLAANGRLPCPDVHRQTSSQDNPDYGRESVQGNHCQAVEGWLPFVTLGGVGRVDAWGNRLRYRVQQRMASDFQQPATSSDWLQICAGGAGANACGSLITDSAAAVVLSHGSNGLGARRLSDDTLNPPPVAGSDEANNVDGRTADDTADTHQANAFRFIAHDIQQGNGRTDPGYDDLVSWMSSSTYHATLLKR